MSAETVNAAFMSDLGGKVGKKEIKIKLGHLVIYIYIYINYV